MLSQDQVSNPNPDSNPSLALTQDPTHSLHLRFDVNLDSRFEANPRPSLNHISDQRPDPSFGVAEIVLPAKDDKVIPIKQGNAIALPFGFVFWWYNKEDTELVVLFLGDTKTGHKAGSFAGMHGKGRNPGRGHGRSRDDQERNPVPGVNHSSN
ncbi:hypothetical protein T459_04809 [Capsicum annuum]|uniref:Cupin type-1 domain-containing protein n=1 Tax=Capsicum annuum TaxID=4072 RepID=A0A2G3A629_CAPAN|nr:hypothetical protein T459_04809 [Capsicum annuum]